MLFQFKYSKLDYRNKKFNFYLTLTSLSVFSSEANLREEVNRDALAEKVGLKNDKKKALLYQLV